jgi:hypothetical protein
MLHLQAPALIKIREGITINLSNSVSQAVEHDVKLRRLKKDYKGNPQEAKPEDFEEYSTANVVSFWFIGGTSLSYRTGEEISEEDFVRISKILTNLQYRMKDDGKPSSKQTDKAA